MRIKTEEANAVTIELDAEEAGLIAADILSKEKSAGTDAVTVANLLRDQGFFLEPVVSTRMEWAGPD